MTVANKKEPFILFLGDVLILVLSLVLTITLRNGAFPSATDLGSHFTPFSFLFIVSLFIYFVAGLYEKQTLVLKRRIPQTLLRVQIINAVVAIAFFYFIPYFAITPKVTLFLYLLISLLLTTWWRFAAMAFFEAKKRQPALLIAKDSEETTELYNEINNNPRYGMVFVEWVKVNGSVDKAHLAALIHEKNIRFIAADFGAPALHLVMPDLYKLIFSGVEFVNVRDLYENIFDRIPLTLIDDAWCLENVSSSSKLAFDIVKRLSDIIVSGVAGIISLIFYPFVYIAIKLDDRGQIFSYQTRVGEHNRPVKMIKFRTMTIADDGGKWAGQGEKPKNVVTRVGKFLRKSRIDELPQLWNVFRGDISLVGPRSEFADPVAQYAAEIPYYNVRHTVKPGLSGWAQIYGEHAHHGVDQNKTRNKLSYDLYYVKNRSISVDVKIVLRTMKVLLSFAGK